MNVALYARVSTDGQDPKASCSPCGATSRSWLAYRRGICHQGFSGTKERRPALDRLMRAAWTGRFQAVLSGASIVCTISENLVGALETFRTLNIQFISLQEQSIRRLRWPGDVHHHRRHGAARTRHYPRAGFAPASRGKAQGSDSAFLRSRLTSAPLGAAPGGLSLGAMARQLRCVGRPFADGSGHLGSVKPDAARRELRSESDGPGKTLSGLLTLARDS